MSSGKPLDILGVYQVIGFNDKKVDGILTFESLVRNKKTWIAVSVHFVNFLDALLRWNKRKRTFSADVETTKYHVDDPEIVAVEEAFIRMVKSGFSFRKTGKLLELKSTRLTPPITFTLK